MVKLQGKQDWSMNIENVMNLTWNTIELCLRINHAIMMLNLDTQNSEFIHL